MANERQIAVVGGGAAGFFGAIACAGADPGCRVTIYEATAHPLAKVRVSGGGRCNVTHACFEPRELVRRYPRGGRELTGAFSRWQPRDTIAWFEERGVTLKTEADGRIFPVTDDSRTIVDCLMDAARRAGVQLRTECAVRQVQRTAAGFTLTLGDGGVAACDRLLLATGGNKANAGFAAARAFGHAIEEPVPSLFTFHVDDPRLKELAGVAVEDASVAVVGSALKDHGPLLVTHWGLSGPAILKLSAWGARELHDRGYRFNLLVNWTGSRSVDALQAELAAARAANPRKQISTWCPLGLPARLWERLIGAAGIRADTPWTSVSSAALRGLAVQAGAGEFVVSGKSLFKEEFVTCGGVRLSEVNFKTMESRLVPGLHFAGEFLDIDGVTGGFNFQAAWTTGWLAGRAMAGVPAA